MFPTESPNENAKTLHISVLAFFICHLTFIINHLSLIIHHSPTSNHSPPLCAPSPMRPSPSPHQHSHIVHKIIAILLRKTIAILLRKTLAILLRKILTSNPNGARACLRVQNSRFTGWSPLLRRGSRGRGGASPCRRGRVR